MTEQEWVGTADPSLMLEFLQGKASDRKLRLFFVGWFRLLGPHELHLLTPRRVEEFESSIERMLLHEESLDPVVKFIPGRGA